MIQQSPEVKAIQDRVVAGRLVFEKDQSLTDLKLLQHLRGLLYLVINECPNVMLDGIEEIYCLKTLEITSCGLKDLSLLDQPTLMDLEHLNLSNNQITDLEPIFALCSLKTLNLTNNLIKDPQQFLFLLRMEVLDELILVGNPVCQKDAEEDREQHKVYHQFEYCLLYALPATVTKLFAFEGVNLLDSLKPKLQIVKDAKTPFEKELLRRIYDKLEAENLKFEQEIKDSGIEADKLDALEKAVVDSSQQIKDMWTQNFVGGDTVQ